MVDISKLANPPAPTGSRSVLDVWLDGLSEKERVAVEGALRNPDWRHVDLLRVLVEEGAPSLSDKTFGHWRRQRGYIA